MWCRIFCLPGTSLHCETLSFTLREEHRMRVFGNRVLWRIFGPRADEVREEWRKLNIAELCVL